MSLDAQRAALAAAALRLPQQQIPQASTRLPPSWKAQLLAPVPEETSPTTPFRIVTAPSAPVSQSSIRPIFKMMFPTASLGLRRAPAAASAVADALRTIPKTPPRSTSF